MVDVNLKSEDGGEYLEIAVDPYPNPISYKGEFYYRSGSTKQVLRGAALSRFLLQKYGRTWDDVPLPGVGLRDLDGRVFDGFRQRGADSERLPQDILDESDEGVIERLQLREAGFLKCAAVLLFHPAPDRFVMEAHVKIGYFRGSELLYQDVIEGDLFTQVDRTMDLLYTKYTRALISYDGVYRVETFPVPREAMREAVINAIIHRDYASPTTIQISVYDDQIAIWNAVQLPSEWAAEQLAGELSSKPYNPRIAYAFFLAGMIEAWGRGIRRIAEMCKEAGNPAPEWKLQSSGDGLWLRFPFSAAYLDKTREHIEEPESLVEPRPDQGQAGVQARVQAGVQAGVQATLSVRDVAMLQACVQQPATSKELRAATSYSGRTKNFRMWLERLLQEELLEMTVPDKPRSPLQRYRLTDKGRAALASLKSENTQT